MEVEKLAIPEVMVLRPVRHQDDRGFFCETYNRRTLAECGIETEFVQDNHALSRRKGTVRGLHFQIPPFGQDKLIRVVRGAILDVAVDIRVGSPTYGRHVSAVISASEGNQIFVPACFAHGIATLEPDTEVIYKVSNHYSVAHDRGLSWNDPDLGIDWPVGDADVTLSDKDRAQPRFADLEDWFR